MEESKSSRTHKNTMAKQTRRQQHTRTTHARKVSRSSYGTDDMEYSDESGIFDMIASGVCGALSCESDSADVPLMDGTNNSIDDESEIGCMWSCQDIRDLLLYGRPPMPFVSIKNSSWSVDRSELTLPRALVRMASAASGNNLDQGELIKMDDLGFGNSAIIFKPMHRPAKRFLSLNISRSGLSGGSRGSKGSKRSRDTRRSRQRTSVTTNSKLYEI